MNHTIDTANGFTIQQRGVGHTWMYFMALRDDVAEIKTHSDLGTLKAWCDKQPSASIAERMEAHAQHTSEWKARGCPKDGRPDTVGYEVQAPVGSTLKEIEEKGFTQWALGSSYDEHREESSTQAHWRETFAEQRAKHGLTEKE